MRSTCHFITAFDERSSVCSCLLVPSIRIWHSGGFSTRSLSHSLRVPLALPVSNAPLPAHTPNTAAAAAMSHEQHATTMAASASPATAADSGSSTTNSQSKPAAAAAAAAAPPDLSSLSRSLEQLTMHFGALAQTLTVVVQQLAAVTAAQAAQTQQQQQPAAASSSANASVPAAASASAAAAASNGEAGERLDTLTLPPAATSTNSGAHAATTDATASAASDLLNPSSDDSNAAASRSLVGGVAGAQLAYVPSAVHTIADADSECEEGALSDDENSSPSHDDSSSGEDEEAAQHANRHMQAQNDELENEVSLSAGQVAKENSINRERERERQRTRSATTSGSYGARPQHLTPTHRNSAAAATAAISTSAATTPLGVAKSASHEDRTVPAAALATAVSPAQSLDSSQSSSPPVHGSTVSIPTSPTAAGVTSPTPLPVLSTSPRATVHAHTSPTLVPFFRRFSAGATASAAAAAAAAHAQSQTATIQPCANAVPLDAEGDDATGSASAPAAVLLNPPHHAHNLSNYSSSSSVTSPVHHHPPARAASSMGLSGAHQPLHQRHPSSPPQRALSPSRMMRGSSGSGGMGSLPFSPPHGHGNLAPPPAHRAHSVSVEVSSSLGGGLGTLHAQQIYLDQAPSKIKLNVGGQLFATTLSTLLREAGGSMFSGMLSGHFAEARARGGNGGGSFFIDRDPTLFRHVLNYLRDGSLCLQGMSQLHKLALLKEARYYGLAGLVGILQLDARAIKTAQRRELSSEKEYKLVEDVAARDMATVIKTYTMEEGYEFENWLTSTSSTVKVAKTSSSKSSTLSTAATVHLLFSKKLSRGELMLLDRLQNHM